MATVTVRDCSGRETKEMFASGTPCPLVFRVLAMEYGACIHADPRLKKSDGVKQFDVPGSIPDGDYLYELAPEPSCYNVVKEKQMAPDPQVLDFMPATAVPPLPIQLACPIFGTFLDNIRNGNTSGLPPPTKNDFKHFVDLVAACSAFYDDEGTLRELLRQDWKKYLVVAVMDEMFTGSANMQGVSRTDLGIRDALYDALVWLTEVKRGVSTSKTEPRMQALLNYKLNWFSARVNEKEYFSDSYCPVLILQHIGQLLHVGAAVLLPSSTPGQDDKVFYQPLTCVELVPIHAHDLQMSLQGVRACMAIKAAVQDLLQLYTVAGRLNAAQGPNPQLRELRQKWIPAPLTQEALQAGHVKQLVDAKLVYGLGRPAEAGCYLVKYCQRYGDEVHRAWAAAGYAPKLMSVENLEGGWIEVRMEWLAREEGWQVLFELKEEEADRLRSRVVKALEAAHRVQVGSSSEGDPTFGVHGDMRDSNVMVRGEDVQMEVRFIDFDWATAGRKMVPRHPGEVGEDVQGGCYPPFMNHAQINWPAGVGENEPMLQSHDLSLLKLKQAEQIKQATPMKEKRREDRAEANTFERRVRKH